MAPTLFELLLPETRVDPYPRYRALRAAGPVYWDEAVGRWVLTRYADVAALLRDPRLSAARAYALETELPEDMRPDVQPLSRAFSSMMLFADPPDHTRLRGLVSKAFTPRMVEALRPRIQRLVDVLLDAVAPQGEMDIIRDLAYPLPTTVIAELLGVPVEDRARLKRWSDDLAAFLGSGPAMPERALRALQSRAELTEYLRGVADEHRRYPRDDLMSALLAAEEQGDVLGDEELYANCALLLAAGHETTTNLIGNGLLTLMRHPEQRRRLQDDPALIAAAVEECLRFESPVQLTGRVALAEIELDGKRIDKGNFLVLLLGAANRDPARFAQPDLFDVGRRDNHHLAFGHGPHFCLGAPLARVEGQIAIQSVLRRMPGLRLVGPEPEWLASVAFRGVKTLPVSW